MNKNMMMSMIRKRQGKGKEHVKRKGKGKHIQRERGGDKQRKRESEVQHTFKREKRAARQNIIIKNNIMIMRKVKEKGKDN